MSDKCRKNKKGLKNPHTSLFFLGHGYPSYELGVPTDPSIIIYQYCTCRRGHGGAMVILVSLLGGQPFKPQTLCGKVGSFLPMIGSLQHRTFFKQKKIFKECLAVILDCS